MIRISFSLIKPFPRSSTSFFSLVGPTISASLLRWVSTFISSSFFFSGISVAHFDKFSWITFLKTTFYGRMCFRLCNLHYFDILIPPVSYLLGWPYLHKLSPTIDQNPVDYWCVKGVQEYRFRASTKAFWAVRILPLLIHSIHKATGKLPWPH